MNPNTMGGYGGGGGMGGGFPTGGSAPGDLFGKYDYWNALLEANPDNKAVQQAVMADYMAYMDPREQQAQSQQDWATQVDSLMQLAQMGDTKALEELQRMIMGDTSGYGDKSVEQIVSERDVSRLEGELGGEDLSTGKAVELALELQMRQSGQPLPQGQDIWFDPTQQQAYQTPEIPWYKQASMGRGAGIDVDWIKRLLTGQKVFGVKDDIRRALGTPVQLGGYGGG